MNFWKQWRYKNLIFFFSSLIFAFFLLRQPTVHSYLLNLGNIGYFGAFIAGILFVSTFTVATGALMLMVLGEALSPIEIGIVAGLGAVIGDLTIFHFIRNKGLVNEIQNFFKYLGGDKIKHLIQTKYFSWTLPVIGAIIIASPFPDEIGVSLMGISKMKTYQFLLTSFILNSIGIFFVVSAGKIIKP